MYMDTGHFVSWFNGGFFAGQSAPLQTVPANNTRYTKVGIILGSSHLGINIPANN